MLKIHEIMKSQKRLEKKLKPFHPIKSATLVAGLLTEPKLHANTIRLEALVHMLLAHGKGNRIASAAHLDTWLNSDTKLSSIALREDPPEDVFISNVITDDGNRRIFEGTWESSDFFLQRLLNVIKALPKNEEADSLRKEVNALLKLSEAIASRRRLPRYIVGGGEDKGDIPLPKRRQLESKAQAITFSEANLRRLGVNPEELSVFIFDTEKREALEEQSFEDSDIIRRPLVYDDEKWVVLLPGCLATALRHHILNWMCKAGRHESFDRQLLAEYRNLLGKTSILGSALPASVAVIPDKALGKLILDFAAKIDSGRYIHLLILVDSLNDFQEHGLIGFSKEDFQLSKELHNRVQHVRAHCSSQEGFKQGLTLVVVCGYGRASMIAIEREARDWWVEVVPASDLQTLSRVSEASSLFLWKLLRHQRHIEESGCKFVNINGLLNMYGHWTQSEYLMLSPDLEYGGKPWTLIICTDLVLHVRKKVRQSWDENALRLPDGSYVPVCLKGANDHFVQNDGHTLYECHESTCKGDLLGACVGKTCLWWLSIEPGKTSLSPRSIFQIWDALHNWLKRAIPVLELNIGKLRSDIILIVLDFGNLHSDQVETIPEIELHSCLSVSIDSERFTIRISMRDPFFGSFNHPENLAERALLKSLTQGTLLLAGCDFDEEALNSILSEIVPNNDARYVHAFQAKGFRDHLQGFDLPEELFIDDADVAHTKLGLGWLVTMDRKKNAFSSPGESSLFLNKVIDAIWVRMRERLRTLNRVCFLREALRCIEGCEAEKGRWERTHRALLALHDDETASLSRAVYGVSRCTVAQIALRIIIEMAVCECPVYTGADTGKLDFAPLMSDAFCIFQFGGWSDAIHKGVMDPSVNIFPNGDIQLVTEFRDQICNPLGHHFVSSQLRDGAKNYDELCEPSNTTSHAKNLFPEKFQKAFSQEFGFTLEDARATRGMLEEIAYDKKQCVFVTQLEELCNHCSTSNTVTVALLKSFLDRFCLWPRERWNKAPDGFKKKDWYPWRFRRRLSLISRPLLRLDNSDNPRYIISPGLLAQSMWYVVSRYYDAEVETSDCRSPLMKEWVDAEKNRQGHVFATKVFKVMKESGYETRLELTLNELLGEKLDKDYGDVDVIAWRDDKEDVLIIECKDIMLAKTPNEMADQLNRFAGQASQDGRRDELLKHLDRCKLLGEKRACLAKTIELEAHNIRIKSVVCFSSAVPMQFIAKRFPDVSFLTIGELREGILESKLS